MNSVQTTNSPHQIWRDLSQNAQFLDAWKIVQEGTDPESWTEPLWQARAARLMERLGAEKRPKRLLLKLWRNRASRDEARDEFFWDVIRSRGAYHAWKWLHAHPMVGEITDTRRAEESGRLAYTLLHLRDFDRARRELAEGLTCKDSEAWLRVVESCLFSAQDRHEESLESAQRAIALEDPYVAATECVVEALLAMGRDEEALATMREALGRMHSRSIAARLVNLELELDLYKEVEESLNAYERYSPLMEESGRDWLAGRRCDLFTHLGNREEALKQVRLVKTSPFYKRMAEGMENAPADSRQKILSVPFVRQHHVTCTPATLTSIARYWEVPVQHLEVAEAICYDGTPHHSERRWAEENGWTAREFTITREIAASLIDRGVPFAMSTVAPGNAHNQAVVGYDDFRGLFIIRDPSSRSRQEFLIDDGLKDQASSGPRGMVMVPSEKAQLLDGLTLPEAGLYDEAFEVELALEKHDRAKAESHVKNLAEQAPGHRITLNAQRSLASYDGNLAEQLDCMERLVALHPEEVNWQMGRISYMEEQKSAEERLKALREVSSGKHGHPLLWKMLASSLQGDSRQHAEVRRWLCKLNRARLDATSLKIEANLLWAEQKWKQATELYRLAACLDSKDEHMATTYFEAARWVQKTEEAVDWLRARVIREGAGKPYMARTLYVALTQLNRWEEAMEVLSDTLQKHATDGFHLLFAAREFNSVGRTAEAKALLDQAKPHAKPSLWHRAAADLARRRGDLGEQEAHWDAVLKDDVLAVDAYRAKAEFMDQREGRKAVFQMLESVCERFPYHWPLHVLLAEWGRLEGGEPWLSAVRKLVAINPDEPWSRRELALAHGSLRNFTEAEAEVELAAALEPRSSALEWVRMTLLHAQGKRDDARKACRAALLLDVDHTLSLRAYVELSDTPEDRATALKFIQEQLILQVSNGAGLLEFQEVALPYLEAGQMRRTLQAGHNKRPDLWQAWSALGTYLLNVGEVEEAIDLMEKATQKFPLLPRVWMDLAHAYAAKGDRVRQIEAMEKVREINPGWGQGMRELAGALRSAGRYEDGVQVLAQAVKQDPMDAFNHGWLAEFMWHLGRKREAYQTLRTALRMEPGYDWAWTALERWGAEMGEARAPLAAARELVQNRPHEVRSWMYLADSLTEESEFQERLEVLGKGLALNPRSWALLSEKARLLALAARFEEALQLCHPEAVPDQPIVLQLREGWIYGYKGELDKGIQILNKVVERDPAQQFAWHLLMEWHAERNDRDGEGRALRKYTQLCPNQPEPLLRLADYQLREKQNQEARATLERALTLAPDNVVAIKLLFDLQLRTSADKAAEVLERGRVHLSPMAGWARDAALARAKSNFEVFCDVSYKMLTCAEDAPDEVELLMAQLRASMPGKYRKKMEDAMKLALESGHPNPHAGACYVHWRFCRGKVPRPEILSILPPGSETRVRANERWLSQTVEIYSEEGTNGGRLSRWLTRRRMKKLIQRDGDWMRQNVRTWGAVGYAINSLTLGKQAKRWFDNWRDHPDAEPWMLNNAYFTCEATGQEKEAQAILEKILATPRHDSTTVRFRLIAAIEAALREDEDVMVRHLGAVDPRHFTEYDTTLHDFLGILRSYLSDPGRQWNDADKIKLDTFLTLHRRDKAKCRWFDQACQLISKRTGKKGVLIWKFFNKSLLNLGG